MGNRSRTVSSSIDLLEPRRLMAFADPVASFGTNGIAGANTGAYLPFVQQADGKIIAGTEQYGTTKAKLVRFTATGAIDTTFTSAPTVDVDIVTTSLSNASNGKLVGSYAVETEDHRHGVGIYRLNANGAFDTTFGTGGKRIAYLDSDQFPTAYRYDVGATVGPDGSIYATLQSSSYFFDFETQPFNAVIIKFTPAGEIDTSWGDNGRLTFSGYAEGDADPFVRTINSVVVREGGTVLIAGSESRPNSVRSYVTRLKADGSVDTRFAGGSVSFTGSVERGYFSKPGTYSTLLRQPDGHLLLGFASEDTSTIVELTADGTRVATSRVGPSGGPFSLAALPDGRLIKSSAATGLQEIRRGSDGSLEVFSPKGPREPGVAAFDRVFGPLILQDGSFVVGGRRVDAPINDEYRLIRLSSGGGNDTRDDLIPSGQQHSVTADEGAIIEALDVFFYDTASKTLKYRHRDGAGAWEPTETVDATPNAGIYLDSIGTVIAYYDGTNGDLKYASRNTNGTWTIETVDSLGSTGLYPSFAYTNAGPTIAYYRKTTGDLKLAVRDTETGWATRTLDRAGDVGRLAVLDVKSGEGDLAIAYTGNGDRDVKFAEQTNGAWAFQTIGTTAGGVGGLDVNFVEYDGEYPYDGDSDDVPGTIAWYDAGPADLVVARREKVGDRWGVARIASAGATGLSPRVQADAGDVLFYDRTHRELRKAFIVPTTNGKYDHGVQTTPVATNVGPFFQVAYVRSGLYGLYGSGLGASYSWYDPDAGGLVFSAGGAV